MHFCGAKKFLLSLTLVCVSPIGCTQKSTLLGAVSNNSTSSSSSSGSSTSTPPPQTSPPPLSGALTIKVQNNLLVDGSGKAKQLRGANFSGLESVAIQGWDPSDPTGGGTPNWNIMAQNWDINVVRIPLNEASWLGKTCTDTGGKSEKADPGGNYQSTVQQLVTNANKAGLYVILDLHWAAPSASASPFNGSQVCPELQTQMADSENSIAFWTSIAKTFQNNPAVIFELFNEPFFDFDFSGDPWAALLQGTSSSLSGFPATGSTNQWVNVSQSWAIASMQAMLNAVRATGATNVVLISGVGYNNDLSGMVSTSGGLSSNFPTDSANQLAVAWHPYPPTQGIGNVSVASGGSGYAVGDSITLVMPNTVYSAGVLKVTGVSGSSVSSVSISNQGTYLQTNLPTGAVSQATSTGSGTGATFIVSQWNNVGSNWSMPSNWPTVLQIASKVPIVITETGEHDQAGTVGAPFLAQLLPWADKNGISYLGWTWNVWGNLDDVLIKDTSGTPTDGYGVYFQQHLLCVGSGKSSCP